MKAFQSLFRAGCQTEIPMHLQRRIYTSNLISSVASLLALLLPFLTFEVLEIQRIPLSTIIGVLFYIAIPTLNSIGLTTTSRVAVALMTPWFILSFLMELVWYSTPELAVDLIPPGTTLLTALVVIPFTLFERKEPGLLWLGLISSVLATFLFRPLLVSATGVDPMDRQSFQQMALPALFNLSAFIVLVAGLSFSRKSNSEYEQQMDELIDDLRRTNRELEEAQRLKEETDRIMRHDLKNPLNGIINLPEILMLEEKCEDEQKHQLMMIRDSGRQMLDLINRSLDLYRMEQGLYQFTPHPVPVRKILDSVIEELRAARYGNAVEIQVHMDQHTEQASFLGEELLLFSLFRNLLKNAAEAVPDHTPVSVTAFCQVQDRVIKLSIRNAGEVPPSIRDHFFDKYTTAGKVDGNGLGTYSALLMTRTLGGQIELDTEEAGYTTIHTDLPGCQ